MHTGDNYIDQSAVSSAHWLVDRSRHVRATLECILAVWPGHDLIDEDRIGIFRFSVGGFTALAAIGGEPDWRLIASHCAASPECVCRLLSASGSAPMHPGSEPAASAFIRDARIKAAVFAPPGIW